MIQHRKKDNMPTTENMRTNCKDKNNSHTHTKNNSLNISKAIIFKFKMAQIIKSQH